MTASSGTEDIDYKALFEQVQTENEGIRIKYFKLKNDEQSFIERIKEKFAEWAEGEYFHVYLYAAIMILVSVVVPLVQALSRLFIRKGNSDEG